ncbi:hypothetical protein SAMN05878426_106144 [Phaeovulum vinaykumarii]|uniref:Uncharacterized protein n=1 Tax=Phaeovulum vinaykumarii TaxID=407234 RepID=A0A1N7M876_9RHOB|nr:hypothetical protein SAMN05421795_10646 [Phaeovulum vinaykumarii]SOC11076.1 hypothetical protein SAMN05878426_106144 [Phaeovulum vinaykumarii]
MLPDTNPEPRGLFVGRVWRPDLVGGLELLAPCDLQAIKACGVTFAQSVLERVIEEKAAGDATAAETIRARVRAVIGDSQSGLRPGSEQAMQVKALLQAEGM